ncbi:MAG: TetR/AcrR family transcriptional regulator [Gaiellales bacterium]
MSTAATTRLTRTRILDAAERLADEGGATAISMRALGAELGADPTAVYRHFPSREAILLALTDRMFGELAAVFTATDDWRADLRRVMLEAQGVYTRHSDLALALARQPWDSPVQEAGTEFILDALTRAGLRGRDLGLMLHVVVTVISGAGLFFALDRSLHEEHSREELRAVHAELPASTHPHTVAAAADLFPPEQAIYEALVESTLDGIERRAESTQSNYVPVSREENHHAQP